MNSKRRKAHYEKIGRIKTDVPLDNPWILVRNFKIKKEKGLWSATKWTKGILKIARLKTKIGYEKNKPTVAVIPLGAEALAARLKLNKRWMPVGIEGIYWIDTDDYRSFGLIGYVPLGVFRQGFLICHEKDNGNYETAL